MSKYAIFGTDAKGVETIKGNGWDINSERIELNGINATFNYELDCKYISLGGPAVEDIFKYLRDLIKENRELEETLDMEINKRDGYINCLKRKLDEKTENYNRLQDLYLKEVNKRCALNERICELEEEIDECSYETDIQNHEFKTLKEMLNDEKMNEKTINYSMNDAMMTKKVYDTDITRMYPSTYSDAAKEILGWIDGEMKNGTDYATKTFNKEDEEHTFNICFRKVPAKSKEDE